MNVGKVSTIFVFLIRLSFFRLGLGAEFDSVSTDVFFYYGLSIKKFRSIWQRHQVRVRKANFFYRQPLLKMTSVDAEFDSELNPSVFKPNLSFRTNMETNYRTEISKNRIFWLPPPSCCQTTPFKNSTVRCSIEFCAQPKSKNEYGANSIYVRSCSFS